MEVIRLLCGGTVLSAALVAGHTAQCAEDLMYVWTDAGKVLTGIVDKETTSDTLWLRNTADGIVLRSSVPFTSIEMAEYKSQRINPEQLPQLVANVATELDVEKFLASSSAGETAPGSRLDGQHPQQASKSSARADDQIQWIDITATMGNWDSDVELDGLVLRLIPRDRGGRTVAVNGTLDVHLFGHSQKGSQRTLSQGAIERWSRSVARDEIDPMGLLVRLPFRKYQPQFEFDRLPAALVHARFGVPQQGAWETSVPLHLRPLNPFRDVLQLDRGQRFLRQERTNWPASQNSSRRASR